MTAVVDERLHAEVRGRVQGVGFRWFVQAAALRRGLTGWARNLPDGRTVELIAEGSRPELEALLADVRRGPSGSYVEAVRESWAPATGEFRDFTIRY